MADSQHHSSVLDGARGLFQMGARLLLFAMGEIARFTIKAPTVDGPETPHLLRTLKGCILRHQPYGGIVAISVPELSEQVVRQPGEYGMRDLGAVHSLSGPDHEGRIAYIENVMAPSEQGKSYHKLKVIHRDGTGDRALFRRPGDALWDHVIGRSVALAPVGGRIAFVAGLSKAQMNDPGALLMEGPLEIWDLEEKCGRSPGIVAEDDPLSWSRDGMKLAYVALIPKSEAGAFPLKPDGFGQSFQKWTRVPAVHLLNCETGERVFMHLGWKPIISSDGNSILVTDFDDHCRLVDVATRQSEPVRIPGKAGRVLALSDRERVLYWALSTTGTPIRHTRMNSPLAGPKPMLTLKIAVLNTDQFQTVVPYVDPRRAISCRIE